MIVTTDACGGLGRGEVKALLARLPGLVVAIVRDPAWAADLAARGVVVSRGGFAEPDTLAAAVTGADLC